MRSWMNAFGAGLCCLAAACGGGNDDQTRRASTDQSMGGESDYARTESEQGTVSADWESPATGQSEQSEEGGSYQYGAEYDTSTGTGGASADMDEGGNLSVGAAAGDDSTGAGTATGPGWAGTQPGQSGMGEGTGDGTSGSFAQAPQPGTSQEDSTGSSTGTARYGETTPVGPAAQVCPADLEGLNVRVSEIPRGGALVFTAASEQVEELRTRLRRFADMRHRQSQGAMGGTTGTEPSDQQGSAGQGSMGQGSAGQGSMGQGSMGQGSGDMAQGGSAQQQDPGLLGEANDVRVVEIPRGARLEIRMDDRTQVRELRDELRQHAQLLNQGSCPVALQQQDQQAG